MQKLFYLFLIAMVGLTACGDKTPEESLTDEYVIQVAKEGTPDEMRRILKKYPEYKEKTLKDYAPVLHYAAVCGTPEMIEVIIESGADVNSQDDLGITAAFRAYALGKGKNLEKLLEYEPDLLIKDEDGDSLVSFRVDVRRTYIFDPGFRYGEPFEEISEEILAKLDKAIDQVTDGHMTKIDKIEAEMREERSK